MEYYAGIDVSLESASLCVVDATGRIVREAKVASEPETLIEWFRGLGIAVTRIGLEAGPLSQWLYAGIRRLSSSRRRARRAIRGASLYNLVGRGQGSMAARSGRAPWRS